ncbi:MAG: hypothetical protein LBM19_00310 [Holosporales bacterium]|nr:hypothetical protein [Holosporales bacterium]
MISIEWKDGRIDYEVKYPKIIDNIIQSAFFGLFGGAIASWFLNDYWVWRPPIINILYKLAILISITSASIVIVGALADWLLKKIKRVRIWCSFWNNPISKDYLLIRCYKRITYQSPNE